MTEQTPEQKAAYERVWAHFRERNPDLATYDPGEVERAAGEFIAAERGKGRDDQDILHELADGTATALRQKLGSERMADTLERRQARMWGQGDGE